MSEILVDESAGTLTGVSRESTALFLADCARISYQTENTSLFKRYCLNEGLTRVASLQYENSAGYMAEHADGYIIALRGSDDLQDWGSNANVTKWNFVHRGFFNYYSQIHFQIVDWLAARLRNAEKPIYVTGHSLGGASAILCAYELAVAGLIYDQPLLNDTQASNLHVFTFGAPRPGDINFYDDYQTRSISRKTHLYVRQFDPIPLMPGAKLLRFGYTHVAPQLFVDESGRVTQIDIDIDDSHIGLTNQINSIWDILGRAVNYAQIPMSHDVRSYIKDLTAGVVG